jgi:signal transduction histidine kinase
MFDRLEHFYHGAHLQKLRLDFHTLDQHITRRQEMARLLAKFPDPALNKNAMDADSSISISQKRTTYLGWINQALFNEPDIKEVIFLDSQGEPTFWLLREQNTGIFNPASSHAELSDKVYIESGLSAAPGVVITSPITLQHTSDDFISDRFMTVRFITPVTEPVRSGQPKVMGAVMFVLDIGGMAKAYPGIHWVLDNGSYLETPESINSAANAFQDFPGLQLLFEKHEIVLWKHEKQQVFWLPFLPSENTGPLWVGRPVDPSPINEFSKSLKIRFLLIVTGLLAAVLLIARWISLRTERVGRQLTRGITNMLKHETGPRFSWKQPEELKELGSSLTDLGEKHVSTILLLRQHAQQLEISNQYKSEFLANVSHELRTPLNSIVLLSKLLANKNDTQFSDADREQAGVIHSAGNDLRILIDSILDLAKIEAGELSVTPQTVNCQELLNEIAALLKPQFNDRQHEFELIIDPDAPNNLVTDADKLRQILLNFLSNAIKFTEQGRIILTYGQNSDDDHQHYPVRFSVKDTGVGIPIDKQAVIFDAFQQADGTSNRRYGGTGLGLTISKELAALIGGYVKLESVPGEGSTFSLTLPLELSNNAPASHSENGNDSSTLLPVASYNGQCILLVDDDLRNLLALTPVLESWGIDVIAAGDGQEALDTLNENAERIKLVLIDLMMPGMDGYETTRKLRADSRFSTLPVIAVSAKADVASQEKASEERLDGFITKPVDPAKLKQIFDDYLVKT